MSGIGTTRFKKSLAVLGMGACAALATAAPASAAPEDLDPTFSGDGLSIVNFGPSVDFSTDAVLQGDGKSVVLGRSTDEGGGFDFAVARLNTDGSLDTSFSGDGKVLVGFGAYDSPESIALGPDGKITVAGYTYSDSATNDAVVARLNTDGSLDSSFSGDGKQQLDLGNGQPNEADAVAVQGDGKIVLAGTAVKPGSQNTLFTTTRLDADSSFDSSFSGDGKQTTDLGGDSDRVEDAQIVAGSKILVSGSTDGTPTTDPSAPGVALRFTGDGSLDTGFSGDGVVSGLKASSAFVEQPDGKVVLAGTYLPPNFTSLMDAQLSIARLQPDGALDTNFGDQGQRTTKFGGQAGLGASSLAVGVDGKIVLGGSALLNQQARDFALARFSAGGSPDTSFSGDGLTTVDSGGFDNGRTVLIQPTDGKIVLAGDTGTLGEADSSLAVLRFKGATSASDITPPETAILSGPSGTTASSSPTFAFSSTEAGSTFECRIVPAAFAPCVSPFTTPSLANGSYTFEVRAVDQSLNTDPTPAARSFTVAAATTPSTPTTPGGPTSGAGASPSVPAAPAPEITAPLVPAKPSFGGGASAGTVTATKSGQITLPRQSVKCGGTGQACTVSVAIETAAVTGKATAAAKKAKTVQLGASSFSVKAGKSAVVTAKLSGKGLKALKRAKRLKATVRLRIKRGGSQATKSVRVTLKAPKSGSKKNRG